MGTPASSTPAAATPPPGSGGILRLYALDAMAPETLDPHLARGGPLVDLHAAVFSKLYRYADEATGTIEPDLAEANPEQPDELTYIVRLRAGVRFHDAPHFRAAHPAATGRALDSSDVKYSIERQTNSESPQATRFLRAGQFGVVDRVETPDKRTVVLRLKEPVAPFVGFLAGRQAFVIARETVDPTVDEANAAAAMIGTGPFVLESFEPGTLARLRRNPRWHAATDGAASRPYLAGVDAYMLPQQDLFQRAAFERQIVDLTPLDDPDELARARTTNLADIAIDDTDAESVLATRLLLDRPPFKDDRVRRAVHLALDRRQLAELLYPPLDDRPSARLSGPVAPAAKRWALADEDLARVSGYAEDRTEALAEARQLLAAALGEDLPPEVPAIVAGVPKLLADRAPAWLERQLFEAIRMRLQPVPDPTGDALLGAGLRRNVEGAAEGVVYFTLAFEEGGPDLDDWLRQFRSGDPANSYRLQDAAIDEMLARQRREFDASARASLGRDIQQYLVSKVNARIDYLAPVRRRLRWGYVMAARMPSAYGADSWATDAWLDESHTAWASRPL